MDEVPLFRDLLARCTDGVFVVDDGGTVVLADEAGAAVVGETPDVVLGGSLAALAGDRCGERVLAAIDDALTTGERSDVVLPLDGETTGTVSFRAVDHGDDRLVTGVVRRGGWSRRESPGSRERYRRLFDAAPDPIVVADATTGELLDVNAAATTLVGVPRDELVGRQQASLHPSDERAYCTDVFGDSPEGAVERREVHVVRDDGRRIAVEATVATVELEGRAVTQTIFRDVGDRQRRERELALDRNELARLNRVNRIIRRINRALVDAENRSEVERAVCEGVVEEAPYVFAWVGSVNRAQQAVVPETWAGDPEGYLDDIAIPLGEEPRGPTALAVETHEVRAIQDLAVDESYGPWRDQALARGYRSSAAIPVVFEDRLFGVLNLYADEADAFDTKEREVLADLGRAIGHALNALERRDALMSDSVLEVELRAETTSGGLLAAAADEGVVHFDRIIPSGEDRYLQYVTVTGLSADRFEELVDRYPGYADVRKIREDEGTGEAVFELQATDPPASSLVASYGGRVTDVVADDEALTLTVELPTQTDVRQFVEALSEPFPDVALVSQRTVPRRNRTPDGIRVSLEDELTDRQRTTLETAYYAGYFEWPRDSTAEDVAERLDVSSPTVHKHLRAAEQKILQMLLD
ncbi:bacterio-opsin activator domain-containing protein [Halomarina ordinaria]|uniref:Bacterio-opsin activator domain-containing protein n=1 Tax=Halomarina ordinaria TaxID=3033939 RepID=A0ABD5U860_9EURY|nr:bacterio-opsin activator domain-containing protein [Halomarina sp. PSRA2]